VKIVPIIRDGKIVMDTLENINLKFPVTNVMWQYMDDMTLGEYLGSLGVDYKSYGFIKSFPRSFYLRIGFYEPGYVITTNSHLYDSLVTVRDNDPWHYGNDIYNCYVHVTTVNGKSVYCVDVLN